MTTHAPEPAGRAHWTPAAEVARELDVDPARGLSPAEVLRRRRRHGPNRLRSVERRGFLEIVVAQLESPLVWILAAGAALSVLFARHLEAVAIGVVIVLNTVIGFLTELRAVRSMEALRLMAQVAARVRRDGEVREVPARDLVPGDVVVLEAGDVVTADVRLTEASRLSVDESALTGESVPVAKGTEPVAPDAVLAERSSMLFKGTAIVRGAGEGVVVATGMWTELGRIASLVSEADDDETPLERQLQRLARQLLWVALGFGLLLVGAGIAAGRPVLLLVETAIALTVAAVPEGLPIVATLVLARGMWRMARSHALVEHLSAVETLGSTTVILTDKTGTLTENRMAVERVEPAEGVSEREVLRAGVLCNDAHEGVGDPMEVALLSAGRDAGLSRDELLARMPEVREEAFDPAIQMMATVHGDGGRHAVFVKGAPERVLEACALDDASRRRWLARSDALAADGMRVLAMATREVDDPSEPVYRELRFLGLAALVDPPRTDVRASIEACHRAGVRVVVVTGDHLSTAQHVAHAAGLDGDAALAGRDVEASSDEELRRADMLARTTPEQKLRVIRSHRGAGDVVAMIGDGVNDAPALHAADIGVAMGRRGTQVAREAADMVLEDDRFATVVNAIAQGRIVFANIRKFAVYLLSCNASEVLVVGLASFTGAPLPLLPLQILFLNLVTDVFPAMALGACEGEPDLMRRAPRDPREGILAARHYRAIGAWSVVLTACVLGAFAVAHLWLGLSDAEAVTVSFLVLAFAQLWHVLNVAERGSPPVVNEVSRNAWVWGAIALCVALILAAVYLPGLSNVLSTTPLDARAWALVAGASLVPVALGLAVRTLRRTRRALRRRDAPPSTPRTASPAAR